MGVAREGRPFVPHLTVGRVREAGDLRRATRLNESAVPDAAGIVDAITLFQSRLSPRGPTYTVLQRTRLQQT